MESKLNEKISKWFSEFKKEMGGMLNSQDNIGDVDMLQFLYNYPHFIVTKEDLQKRPRTKNIVPFHDRCRAIRANQEQCTRRKRDDESLCGTHIKGTPHGKIEDNQDKNNPFKKVQVWAHEVGGIIRHLDNDGNVYEPQDILMNIINPRVIAKYTNVSGEYKFT
jgi:hypothetical protein